MKVRIGFVSNSSSCSFLLGVKGEVHKTILAFLAKHIDDIQKFKEGEDLYLFSPELVAECITDGATPLDARNSKNFKRYLQEYFDTHVTISHTRREIQYFEGLLSLPQELHLRGMQVYWVMLWDDCSPGNFVIDFLKSHLVKIEDENFFLEWLPFAR